jgi:YD repeat-containing protein
MTSILGQTLYSYNQAGELTSLVHPLGNTTAWQFDHAG